MLLCFIVVLVVVSLFLCPTYRPNYHTYVGPGTTAVCPGFGTIRSSGHPQGSREVCPLQMRRDCSKKRSGKQKLLACGGGQEMLRGGWLKC